MSQKARFPIHTVIYDNYQELNERKKEKVKFYVSKKGNTLNVFKCLYKRDSTLEEHYGV